MNFLKVAITLKKQLRDTAQMERHRRVREHTCFFRNVCLEKKKSKRKLCRKTFSENQIDEHFPFYYVFNTH